MHDKDLRKANPRCIETIKNNAGCAFCRGVKRCEDYPQDVDKAMKFFNDKWQKEWDIEHNIEPVKKKKHKSPNNKDLDAKVMA